jgi:hypothetical protein
MLEKSEFPEALRIRQGCAILSLFRQKRRKWKLFEGLTLYKPEQNEKNVGLALLGPHQARQSRTNWQKRLDGPSLGPK